MRVWRAVAGDVWRDQASVVLFTHQGIPQLVVRAGLQWEAQYEVVAETEDGIDGASEVIE